MIKSILRIAALSATLCSTYFFLASCGSAGNTNLANTVGTGNVNINGMTMPPGFSTSPVPINGPVPGIPDPANANIQIKPGSSPIPGIDPKNINVKPRAGADPTPGIPSEAELRRQLGQLGKNPTTGNTASSSTNATGPRTSRKPKS